MSGLYVYGIVGAEAPDDIADGLEGLKSAGPVRRHPCGSLALLASETEETEILPVRRNMLAHARVLEQALLRCAVLPVSFGQVCHDISKLGALFADHAAALHARLDRLRGRAEYGVRIRASREAVLQQVARDNPEFSRRVAAIAPRGAAAHFERIEIGRQVADAVAAFRDRAQRRLLEALAPHAVDHVLHAPEDDVEMLRAAFLVNLDGESSFERTLAGLAGTADFGGGEALEVRLVGPGPASSFVHLRLETGLAAATH